MSSARLNLVVAACSNNGIGKNGELPWRLKKDIAFFKKITSETKLSGNQNAVIMGRKTWFSIPEKFRPLKGRVNIVLSRELKEVPEGVHIARSLSDAIKLVTSNTLDTQIENIHIIGGSSVYQEAMTGPYDCRLYLTRIFKEFDCDTFLPAIDDQNFQKVTNPEDISDELQTENEISFKFEVYDKVSKTTVIEKEPQISLHGTSSPPTTKDDLSLEATLEGTHIGHNVTFNIMAAMCDGSRGIGNKSGLPWPSLRADFERYLRITCTPRLPVSDGSSKTKMIIHINGRITFQSVGKEEMGLPNVFYIVISKTLKESNFVHPKILKIVESFDEALDHCDTMWTDNQLDSVWVMGGQSVYKVAVKHQRCHKLYLTHIYTDFTADSYFPQFEQDFTEIKESGTSSEIHTDNGVQFEFKVYRRTNT